MLEQWWFWVVVGYLSGSVPFGLLIGLVRGVDIRQHGSRNIGATNCGRVLGRPFGIACFVLDVFKGLLPVLAAGAAMGHLQSGASPSAAQSLQWLAVAVAAMLGHVFPVWLRFKGGKGVATGLGVVIGYWPVLTVPGFVALGLWVALVLAFRYVSLASVVAAVSLPVSVTAMALARGQGVHRVWPFLVVTLLLAGLVVLRHRTNLSRLAAGTEPKIGRKREDDPTV